MKAFHLLINFWAQIAKAQRMFHKVIFGLQLFQVLVPWNLQISNGRTDCPLLEPTFHLINEEWIFLRTFMSVLAGPCPTQKLSKGLRRTKAKPALFEPLPSATSRRMAENWREPWSPLSKITMCRELGDYKSFISGCSEVLALAWCSCWAGGGEGAPVGGRQPGGLLGILGRSAWGDWVWESWNIPQITPNSHVPNGTFPAVPRAGDAPEAARHKGWSIPCSRTCCSCSSGALSLEMSSLGWIN